ncbi:MAG: hypothetical protein KBE09_05170 [Candidatus Pacebacteria bacterium]|nr:hypothetical protein [Candidatus Paceibacterota bacterium]
MVQPYKVQPLGRPAFFLMPSLKLKLPMQPENTTVEGYLHDVLVKEFGGYTAASSTMYGFWVRDDGGVAYGEHRAYRVAFIGKERIPILTAVLSEVARRIEERCIYLETGEEACLVYARGVFLEGVSPD